MIFNPPVCTSIIKTETPVRRGFFSLPTHSSCRSRPHGIIPVLLRLWEKNKNIHSHQCRAVAEAWRNEGQQLRDAHRASQEYSGHIPGTPGTKEGNSFSWGPHCFQSWLYVHKYGSGGKLFSVFLLRVVRAGIWGIQFLRALCISNHNVGASPRASVWTRQVTWV